MPFTNHTKGLLNECEERYKLECLIGNLEYEIYLARNNRLYAKVHLLTTKLKLYRDQLESTYY